MKTATDALRECVQYQVAALRVLLDAWMRRASRSEQPIVVVDGVGYY